MVVEIQSKDWTGNKKTTFVTIGASNHSGEEREKDDYYATDPKAIELLLELEEFQQDIWECACGAGHLSEVLKRKGYNVKSSDIKHRGYKETEIINFLDVTKRNNKDIITNPPYKYAKEFVEKAIEISEQDTKIAMFLKLTFLESEKRKSLFRKYPPQKIWVSSKRLKCAKNGDFENTGGSAVAYAWFIWKVGYKGKITVDIFN